MIKTSINKEWIQYILRQKERGVSFDKLEEILIRKNYSIDIIYDLLYKNKNSNLEK